MRPFFPYFGSKWRAVPRYPAPQHDTIIEPFAGAAGYSVRHHELEVRLSDVDPHIVGVWSYLIGATADDIMALPLPAEFNDTEELELPLGARWLIGFWLNPGSAQPKRVPSQWCRTAEEGGWQGSVWSTRTRERVASQVGEIKHWIVEQASFEALADDEATWFVDPPYIGAGKDYRFGARDIDYTKLAAWCRSRRGQVVVCENEGADWLPFESFATIKGTEGKGRTGVSHEVVWLQ